MTNQISQAARQAIFDVFRSEEILWFGRLGEVDFLKRLFTLSTPVERAIREHCEWHADWPIDWVFSDPDYELLTCDDDTFLRFISLTLAPVVRPEFEAKQLVVFINRGLKESGWEFIETDGLSRKEYSPRKRDVGVAQLVDGVEALIRDRTAYLDRQIQRLRSDAPEVAIGSSRELIETVCKTILEERHVSYLRGVKLPKLVWLTADALDLTPLDIPDSARGAQNIKQLLGNLVNIATQMAELRNLYGTGHGKSARYKGLTKRHADLAVGAATTVCVFLWRSHEGRS